MATNQITARRLASGAGWYAEDIVCTADRRDRPYEEQHREVSVAFVVAGTFQYRSATGRALMTPGSLLLGNAGESFECAHDHGAGDRCISFKYAPDSFAAKFHVPRLPAISALSFLAARVSAAVARGAAHEEWEELAVEVAANAAALAGRRSMQQPEPPRGAEARVTRIVRAIEHLAEDEPLTLHRLAAAAGLSPYHFLRTFRQITGVTPHQYVRRARLRQAAARLIENRSAIIDVALDCGFGDISNFNRAFRAEFGMSPRQLRRAGTAGSAGLLRLAARVS